MKGLARELALVTRISDGFLIQTRTAVRFAANVDAMLTLVREVAEAPGKPDQEIEDQKNELMKMIREGM